MLTHSTATASTVKRSSPPAHSRSSMSLCPDGVTRDDITVVREYEHTRIECNGPPVWLCPLSPELLSGNQRVCEIFDKGPFADSSFASNLDFVTNLVANLCVTPRPSHGDIESDNTLMRLRGTPRSDAV